MQIFWDLDGTLFDSERYQLRLIESILERGHARDDILRTLGELNGTGYSFQGHLMALGEDEIRASEGAEDLGHLLLTGEEYLYPGIQDLITRLYKDGAMHHLVTFGHTPYQRAKWNGLPVLHPLFTGAHFVPPGTRKGVIIQAHAMRGPKVVFIDDSIDWLGDVRQCVPQTLLVRMNWTRQETLFPHAAEVRNATELEELLRRIR